MQLLLDTTFLWWLAGDRRLSAAAKRAIAEQSSRVFVSAASVWEITTKYRLGKLRGVAAIVDDLAQTVAAQDFRALPITLAHAQRAGSLPSEHRDPFDRMLIAQSELEGLRLVSNEKVFDRFASQRIW